MSDLNRRNFLRLSSLTGAGLVLGFRLPDSAAAAVKDDLTVVNMRRQETTAFSPNVFLSINAEGIITIQIPRSELGQGVNTTLAMLIAEELDADWSMIRTEQSPPGSAYGNQVTGGSRTISESYSGFRMAGATARTMLISAAALTWNVTPDTCATEQGVVIHTATDQRLTYGELVAVASTLEVPKRTDVTLKAETDFKLIGTRVPSKDVPDMVTGRAIYTSDVRVEGMLVGVVARCPVFGGKVASYDASAALAVEGVRQVVEISSGIAVVANNTWAAIKGRDALVITWDEGKNADLNSEAIRQMMMEQAVQTDLDQNENVVQYLEALYELPYLAHAPMEPLSAAADVRADNGDIWGMTQNRSGAQNAARNAADVPMALHVPLIGGQFGRGHWFENIEDAAEVSRLVAAPVRVIWTREEDMQYDHYRPASVHWVRAGLDASGQPITWEHHIGAQGIDGGGSELLEGAYMPYKIKQNSRGYAVPLPIPTGYWRAVYNNQCAFVNESFMDEIAVAGGKDPLELRLSLLTDDKRIEVLQIAAEKAGWGTPLPAGWGRGIVQFSTWDASHLALVAEVSVAGDGSVRVQRVVCAANCGRVVNPSVVEAQIEGGIVFALSAALYGEITLDRGRVQQGNFSDYPVLRMNEMPLIEIHLVESSSSPSGMGEIAGPPTFAVVTNAIYAATGQRIRRLPIRKVSL